MPSYSQLVENISLFPTIFPSKFPSENERNFYYHALLKTIDAFLSREYSKFDAHTTSTCCHGIALYAQEVILEVRKIDLDPIKTHINNLLLDKQNKDEVEIPTSLENLCSLFICSLVKDFSVEKNRVITNSKKIKSIYPISNNLCNKIAFGLQKQLSNLVAKRYAHLLDFIPSSFIVNGVPVDLWGKYIQESYLRTDKKGISYASCLYSMQVSLAYLIYKKAKIAVIHDLKNIEETSQFRYVYLLQGDGKQGFVQLDINEQGEQEEPVVVFSGCSLGDHNSLLEFKNHLNNFPKLVLACDVFYPQFPRVLDDPNFSNHPISPEELPIVNSISLAKEIPGVSLSDPSLFCLSHIYPASLQQVIDTAKGASALPAAFLPSIHHFS
jgi:hypothetical protein